ncbi:DUF4826 family protein [Shewanella surugensis]|uniref:DUF4826 family protein n=1 Tax=Shewanella surugensis TaxID=212020 RepID=A0ABT0LHK7_9GAMM|nr:DUF4826 family protein [Shewanella surugensis]MCL1126792.1 DUF4826 family protein [Shewanella surugensis]
MAEEVIEQSSKEEQDKLRQEWIQTQFQKANKFLAEKGILPSKVHPESSRYLAPFVAIWKIESKKPIKQTFWVMSGDLPADYVDINVAATARDALRHFSMVWQMKAENIRQSTLINDPTQAKFAQLLVSRAESLYQIHNDDKLWG